MCPTSVNEVGAPFRAMRFTDAFTQSRLSRVLENIASEVSPVHDG